MGLGQMTRGVPEANLLLRNILHKSNLKYYSSLFIFVLKYEWGVTGLILCLS